MPFVQVQHKFTIKSHKKIKLINIVTSVTFEIFLQPLDPTKGGSTSEGVLANFFNSLLSKKPASPGAPGAPTPGGGTPPNAKPGT